MNPKSSKRAISGVLLLDKPVGISSNLALQKARRLFNAEKAGHTGVLDPLASGLLPVCLGEATKFAQYLLDADKAYTATLKLGEATTTGDAEGELIDVADKIIELIELINNIINPLIIPENIFPNIEDIKLFLSQFKKDIKNAATDKIINIKSINTDGILKYIPILLIIFFIFLINLFPSSLYHIRQ